MWMEDRSAGRCRPRSRMSAACFRRPAIPPATLGNGTSAGQRAAFGFGTIGVENDDVRIAEQAADWIRKQRSPWLAWVSVLNPHHIYSLEDVAPRPGVRPPFSDLRNLAGKPPEQQAYVDKDQGTQTRNYSLRRLDTLPQLLPVAGRAGGCESRYRAEGHTGLGLHNRRLHGRSRRRARRAWPSVQRPLHVRGGNPHPAPDPRSVGLLRRAR